MQANPLRERKCLLNRQEINKLRKNQDADGYTIVPLNLHWRNGKAKLQIAIAKGKKLYDKRETAKQRDWDRQKQRNYKDC